MVHLLAVAAADEALMIMCIGRRPHGLPGHLLAPCPAQLCPIQVGRGEELNRPVHLRVYLANDALSRAEEHTVGKAKDIVDSTVENPEHLGLAPVGLPNRHPLSAALRGLLVP